MKILFVCSGNTCRSPVAEIVFREEALKAGLCSVEAASAGILSWGGDPISEYSSRVLAAAGYSDGEEFRSTEIDFETLNQWDYVVTMSKSHVTALLLRRPDLKDKIRLLAQSGEKDIADPFGGYMEDYERAFQEIKEGVLILIEELKNT